MDQPELHWSERVTLDPASSCAPQTAATRQAGPLPRSRVRKAPIIWAVVACLVLAAGIAAFVLIDAKNAAAAEQKAKVVALAQMGTYTDYATGVSFQVPISWEQIPVDSAMAELGQIATGVDALPSGFIAFADGDFITGGSGQGAVMIFAAQDYPSGYVKPAKDSIEKAMARFKDTVPSGFSFEAGVREIKAASLKGTEVTMSIGNAGSTAMMRMCILDSNSRCFMFIFGADEYTWEKSRYFFDCTVEGFSLVGAQ